MDRAVASGATGRRFESCQAYHLSPLESISLSFPSSPQMPETYQKCTKIPSVRCHRTRIPRALICGAIELGESFPHHVELGLAVPLKDAGIALPEHQRDEVVGYTTGAEPRRERVAKLI